ncbi:nitroreductase [Saxibacter everestensis]|uniref:Putative NAD(P)H nitroreductase n=1 Tax=Saxibacter everestensis TaxID=2909229 RepID=A0ABY8QPW1_9MICO|nr:nitroreductase [Brevibacteriaceae bacterium ZFBP1038]
MTNQDFLATMAARRSISTVDDAAPSDADLLTILRSVTPVADHKGLKPWRLVTLRGDDRIRLGRAFDKADGKDSAADRFNRKPLRAPLLIAVIASPKDHGSVPRWEQEAVASGAAHLLSLALWAAGWGVMWRTGSNTEAKPVRKLHGVRKGERLMGWLYVGAIPEKYRAKLESGSRKRPDPNEFLHRLPE